MIICSNEDCQNCSVLYLYHRCTVMLELRGPDDVVNLFEVSVCVFAYVVLTRARFFVYLKVSFVCVLIVLFLVVVWL